MKESTTELEIRKAVRDRYSKLATTSGSDCCGGPPSDCRASSLVQIGEEIPVEASSVNASCGSPLQLVTLKPGDTIVDLGSGGGIDIFRASQIIGENGRAIGVDATAEMIWRARDTTEKHREKYRNVEFRLGEIEHLPVETSTMDYVISNCVINLSPDKLQVFREAFRVLKPEGTFAVADITLQREIPEEIRKDLDSWSSCIAGALTDAEYAKLLKHVGFKDIKIENISTTNIGEYPFPYFSSHIKARKTLA
jgi:arsenite methyltransferase